MIVYHAIKKEFMRSVETGSIATQVENAVLERMGHHTGISEFNSWKHSLQEMHMVLSDKAVPDDAGIAIEYNIPQTSKRIDFIISGYNKSGHPNVVIIELKQWEKINAIDGPEALVETYTGGGYRTVVHPAYQVWSYASLIRDYNQSVQGRSITINPCCYLHNYEQKEYGDPLVAPQYQTYIEDAPVFTYGQALELRSHIKKSVIKGDSQEILYDIENGKIHPSKSLQDAIGSMLAGNQEFVMIDEQKVAYESILQISTLCQKDGKKRTIVVRGGPGTGKSVIAVNLLAELTKRGQFVQYVSKNSAPEMYIRKSLKETLKRVVLTLCLRAQDAI